MSDREEFYQPSLLDTLSQKVSAALQVWFSEQHRVTRRVMIGVILTVALICFELFNFDTTEYALENLLGAVSFGGIRWATILAVAFCGIDFAGLARLLTPAEDHGPQSSSPLKPSWLLMGAWLMGGGMNAIMTWWSISLALMDHNLGNEVLTRAQLVHIVPVFVAVLVWLTRILIIGSFIMATDKSPLELGKQIQVRPRNSRRPQRALPTRPPMRQPNNAKPVYTAQNPQAARQPSSRSSGRKPPRPNGRPTQQRVNPRRPRGVRPPAVPVQMKDSSDNRRKLV